MSVKLMPSERNTWIVCVKMNIILMKVILNIITLVQEVFEAL